MTLEKGELLGPLARLRTDEIVVTTMGVVRPWATLSDSDLDLASADSAMGHAADLALGIALARPDRRVWCLNGDGSMLMTLGTLATIIASNVTNLVLVVVDNGTFEITGNQPVPAAGRADYAALARAAGFEQAHFVEDAGTWDASASAIVTGPGPVFVHARVVPGDQGPITRGDHEEAPYLKVSLRESARIVRRGILGS